VNTNQGKISRAVYELAIARNSEGADWTDGSLINYFVHSKIAPDQDYVGSIVRTLVIVGHPTNG